MAQTAISYPEGFAQLLEVSETELASELLFLAAAKLYELGRLTAGQAARLASLDRLEFLDRLGRVGVPAINLQDDEIAAEIKAARELAG